MTEEAMSAKQSAGAGVSEERQRVGAQARALADKLVAEVRGAVVSPRDLESTRRIRALMPNCLFLVPGFGAQGRTAKEVAECFKPDGTGAIVKGTYQSPILMQWRKAEASRRRLTATLVSFR